MPKAARIYKAMMSGGTIGQEATVEQRIAGLVRVGAVCAEVGAGRPWPGHACGLTREEYDAFVHTVEAARHRNGWFTAENVRHALSAWGALLTTAELQAWTAAYPDLARNDRPVRTVGLILAGNIPLVGLHDLVCVLLSGHRARVKASSEDAGLTQGVLDLLRLLAPEAAARVELVADKLGAVDAVIATGSDNTARYFQHYFGHLPLVVRRNRTSVAVLDGTETPTELAALGEDVFRYFGLGCRNVGKVFLPADFDLDRLFGAIFPWKDIVLHGKYANNYDYHKALWLLDGVPLLENGFLLVKEDVALHSPVGALFVERYIDRAAVDQRLGAEAARIQCVVGHGQVAFGQAQAPGLTDYADGVDTMAFLLSL